MLLACTTLQAQQGQTELTKAAKPHSPKKAGWMSAALPGLGQVYNKKYWKLPILYGGLAGLTYLYIQNNQGYIEYRDAYRFRISDDYNGVDGYPYYTTENLRVLKNEYWKNRDLTVIIIALVYTANILDAVVDAHFFTYDVSDDLSFNVSPTLKPTIGLYPVANPGLSFSLNF